MSDTDSYHYRDPDETHRPPTDDEGTLLASPTWAANTVRALVADPTEPDAGIMDLVTSRQAVKQEAKKCGLSPHKAEGALDDAIDQGRVFAAPEFGHLCPMADEHLVAVIEAEREAADEGEPNVPEDEDQISGFPRGSFIGQCNEAIAEIRERKRAQQTEADAQGGVADD